VTRLDKFLWAARFYKTRALAVTAIEAGRVSVNGERAKPAKAVKPGDRLEVRRPPFEQAVVVRALAEQRGSATVAQTLYEETPESRERRDKLVAELRAAPPPVFKGRPTKKSRRDYEKWLYSQDDD
jgi:ribosome-associated heat shock protein Hsp15